MAENNDDFKKISEQYLQSCQEQIQALARNPAMLQKALEPFMKMQQEYLNNPESMGLLSENITDNTNSVSNSSSSDDDNINVSLQKILHRLQGIRKKVLPQVMDKLEKIDRRIIAIEEHLGITSESENSAESVEDDNEDAEE